eukprot:scaffold9858_cov124-Isochrysis_galbana.AAC.1
MAHGYGPCPAGAVAAADADEERREPRAAAAAVRTNREDVPGVQVQEPPHTHAGTHTFRACLSQQPEQLYRNICICHLSAMCTCTSDQPQHGHEQPRRPPTRARMPDASSQQRTN